jgi:hypothetical protein
MGVAMKDKNKRYVQDLIAELDDPYLGSESYRIGEYIKRKELRQSTSKA